MDSCAGKLIRSNHRLMGTYVQLMPRMVQRRMEEMESKAAENAKAAEVAAAGVETANVDASPAFQTPLNSPPSPGFPPSGTEMMPEVQSSVLKTTRLEVLTDPAATGAKLSAATLLTPKTETVLNDASHAAGSAHLSAHGFQTESGSPEPTSLSAPTES